MHKNYCHIFFDEYPKDSRIRRYTNSLLSNNYKVFIVCLETSQMSYFEKDGNCRIYRLPIKKKRSTFLRRFYEYFIFQVLATIIVSYLHLKYRISAYHVHTLPDFLVFSCIFPKIWGAKIILDFHELFPEFMIQHKPSLTYNSLIVKLLLLQEKLSFKFANQIVVFHDPAGDILKTRIETKKPVSTIMNGVDESEFRDFKKTKSEYFNIIYNGTINFNLNLTLIIRALDLLRENRIDIYEKIRFLIYGDGPDLSNILDLSKSLKIENVYYMGRVNFKEMVIKLQDANLCILPPLKDIYSDLFYSLKLLEMIYFKIPVIATRLKTYEKYYPEKCVFYFESGNVQDLTERIIFVYENIDISTEYTNRAYEEYKKYSWDIMEKRFIKMLTKI
jgi:glycosyltransferase involved in cell wall biosynthesis